MQSSLSFWWTLRTKQHLWKCEEVLFLITVRRKFNCFEMGRFLWSSGCRVLLHSRSVDQRDAYARCKFSKMKLLLQNESWSNPADNSTIQEQQQGSMWWTVVAGNEGHKCEIIICLIKMS